MDLNVWLSVFVRCCIGRVLQMQHPDWTTGLDNWTTQLLVIGQLNYL
jgi:hypothetical protein